MGAMVRAPHPAANWTGVQVPTFADGFRFSDRLSLGRWEAPARGPDDVWQGFPSWLTSAEDPVRDAIGAGLAGVFLRASSAASAAMASRLRAHATGWRLDLYAAGVGVSRSAGERDHALRARLATVEDVVSEGAVEAAVAAVAPDAVVIYPWRHGLYAGRGFLNRPPVDWRATRAAADGRLRLYPVGPVRAWSSVAARIHVVLPPMGAATYAGPTATPRGARLWATRSLSGARCYLSSVDVARNRTLAGAVERVRAAGVRWTASFDTTATPTT